jgi:hypothetical protein
MLTACRTALQDRIEDPRLASRMVLGRGRSHECDVRLLSGADRKCTANSQNEEIDPEPKSVPSLTGHVFHPAPWMQHATPVFDECEVVTATTGLIMGSINRKTRIVAEQKSADGAVAYKEHIARPISS